MIVLGVALALVVMWTPPQLLAYEQASQLEG